MNHKTEPVGPPRDSVVKGNAVSLTFGVVDPTRNGAPAPQGHRQSITAKLGPHMILYQPTKDIPLGHVFHTSEIKPASIRIDTKDLCAGA